jgi:hypothetical protein
MILENPSLFKHFYHKPKMVNKKITTITENSNTFLCLAANQYTLGHLLIIGYLSKDIVASWCSGIALAHLIADSQQYKEAILKVVLAVDQAQTGAKTLMEISIDLLQNVNKIFLFLNFIFFFVISIVFIFISYSCCCTDIYMHMVIKLFISSSNISFNSKQYFICR